MNAVGGKDMASSSQVKALTTLTSVEVDPQEEWDRSPRYREANAALTEEFRLRFYNFNMANSSKFKDLTELIPGRGGEPGTFDTFFTDPCDDGTPVDLAFVSLVETRLDLAQWTNNFKATWPPKQLDDVLTTSSSSEAWKDSSAWGLRGLAEGLAAGYNGNLMTIVGFNSKKFTKEEGNLFGRLPEKKIGGVSVPNPKKAFSGSIVSGTACGLGLKVICVGSHFPVEKIGEMFDEKDYDVLRGAKIAVAKVMRKILRRAGKRGLLDNSTMLILQGDLNSRTVLEPAQRGGDTAEPVLYDVLDEVLKDSELQQAIQQGLPVPSGRWREMCPCPDAKLLPVTYKFAEKTGPDFEGKDHETLTFKDVLKAAHGENPGPDSSKRVADTFHTLATEKTPVDEKFKVSDKDDLYKKTLKQVGAKQLADWGLVFKPDKFRPFRYPAAADRVVCWAPLGLAARTTFELSRAYSYEVVHTQGGSDHRPVRLDGVLRVGPPVRGGAAASFVDMGETQTMTIDTPVHWPAHIDLFAQVKEDDEDDSDVEPFPVT